MTNKIINIVLDAIDKYYFIDHSHTITHKHSDAHGQTDTPVGI